MTTKQKINLFLLGTIAIIPLSSLLYEAPIVGMAVVMILVLAYFIFFSSKEKTQQIKLLHTLGLWIWGLLGVAVLIIIGIATYYKLDEQYNERQEREMFQKSHKQVVQKIQQEFLRGLKWVYRNTGTLEQCRETNPGDKYGCVYGLLAIQSGIDHAINKNPTTNYDCDDQDWMFKKQSLLLETNAFRHKCTRIVLEHECKKGLDASCKELEEIDKDFYRYIWAIDHYHPDLPELMGWVEREVESLIATIKEIYPRVSQQAIEEALRTL